MKYLLINVTAGYGSTGRIAVETCKSLMAQGHECRIAYGRFEALAGDVPVYRIGSDLDIKINGLLSRTLDDHGFGLKAATKKFLGWVRDYDPDVIWLHNLHGYYLHVGLLFDYLRTSGKEIIWTLHDCWVMTGHCSNFAYAGCDRWKTGCHDCPEKKAYPSSFLLDASAGNYRKKKALFTGIPNLRIITPSAWLQDLVKQSYLKEYPVSVCYNTINTEIFRPAPGNFREKFHLEHQKILLSVASIFTERKGIRELIALSKLITDDYRMVIVGKVSVPLPENILHIERTDSPRELAEIYTAADLLINATLEDTYPTVNLEALACGTPVITYRTGGSPESLDETCGAVTDQKPEALWAAIQRAHFRREDCLKRSRQLNHEN